MKRNFCIIIIAFLFSSCVSTYYYSTLDTTTTENMIKEDNGDFISGNDSIMIAYCFNGEEGPILIMIQNDGNTPLYVDWQRSSIIYQNKATSYYNRNLDIAGTTSTSSYSIGNNSNIYSNGQFRGKISVPDGVSFIPPHSRIEYNTNRLETPSFGSIQDKAYSKAPIINKNDIPVTVNKIDFTPEDTPFKFRSYLTLYTDPNHPFTFEHEFFISNLIKSKVITPSNIDQRLAERGDFFYIEK